MPSLPASASSHPAPLLSQQKATESRSSVISPHPPVSSHPPGALPPSAGLLEAAPSPTRQLAPKPPLPESRNGAAGIWIFKQTV